MKPLEAGASKAEVIAAVVEHERRRAEYDQLLRRAIFPDVPDDFVGCVQSLDGTAVACHRGTLSTNPAADAQARAGEEDQSQPGWEAF